MKNSFLARMAILKKNLEEVKRNFPANEVVMNTAAEYHEDHDSHHDQPDLAFNRAMWEQEEDEEDTEGDLNKAEAPLKSPKAKKEPKPKAEPKLRMVNKPREILPEHEKDRSFVTGVIRDKLNALKSQLEKHLTDGSGDEALLAKVKKYKPEFREDVKEKKKYIHLGDKSAVFRDILDETYHEHGPKFHPKIGVGNSKLENEAVATWSIPEKDFCPGAGDCIKGCYVTHGPMGWNSAAISRWVNAYSAKNDHFVPTINKLLSQFDKARPVTTKDWDNVKSEKQKIDAKGNPVFKDGKEVIEKTYHDRLDAEGKPIQHNWTHFRIHDSGDFHDDPYTEKWGSIVKDNPKIKFYAYSKTLNEAKKIAFKNTEKSHRMLKAMHDNSAGNFNLRQSLGGVHDPDIDPDKPHAVIFPDHESRKLAGYDDISNYDRASADREMVKGGLVYHGPKKDYNFRRHLARSPKLNERLAHVLEDYENRMKQAEADKPIRKRSRAKTDDKLAASEVGSLIKSLIYKINKSIK